jgi:hypothetical protein
MRRTVRHFSQIARAHAARALALLLLVVPAGARAQETGNGYMFGEPAGQFTLRAGYPRSTANSDLFQFVTDEFTLGRSAFAGVSVGAELALRLTSRLDLALGADYAVKKTGSEYRHFVDNNNNPIEQTTTFQRVPMSASLRYYPTDRGRSVGTLAWIPASVSPWIGAGGGLMWYRFKQEGDFISSATNKVYPDKEEASGWRPLALGMAGVDINLTPRIALVGDARYTWVSPEAFHDQLADYSNYTVDASGMSVTLGLTFRL